MQIKNNMSKYTNLIEEDSEPNMQINKYKSDEYSKDMNYYEDGGQYDPPKGCFYFYIFKQQFLDYRLESTRLFYWQEIKKAMWNKFINKTPIFIIF